jgi:hypothetical protein
MMTLTKIRSQTQCQSSIIKSKVSNFKTKISPQQEISREDHKEAQEYE